MKIPRIMGGPKPAMVKPPAPAGAKRILPAMKVPDKNPLEKLKPTGELQADVEQEIDEISKGFRERMAAEAERRDAATGTGEYFIVCFANGEQCDSFLAQLAQHVRSVQLGADDLVIDGRDLARFLKFTLPEGSAVGKEQKKDPDWSKRSLP